MEKGLAELKRERETEHRGHLYGRGILEALLYYSTTKKDFMLPTIKELVHREVIHGTVECITGKESKYKPVHDIQLEGEMWKYFQKVLRNNGGKLDSKIETALVKMLEPRWKSDEVGDGEYESELYLHFHGFCGGGICKLIMCSTFSLPQEVIHHIQEEVVPSLSKPERDNVKRIGMTMRKYINKDLEYIRENYHW